MNIWHHIWIVFIYGRHKDYESHVWIILNDISKNVIFSESILILISYFCSTVQKVVVCGSCGMGKCMNKSPGGCLVKHGQNYVTGIKLAGAICDHCEAFICHGRQVKTCRNLFQLTYEEFNSFDFPSLFFFAHYLFHTFYNISTTFFCD